MAKKVGGNAVRLDMKIVFMSIQSTGVTADHSAINHF
jgi:hypothetical protein